MKGNVRGSSEGSTNMQGLERKSTKLRVWRVKKLKGILKQRKKKVQQTKVATPGGHKKSGTVTALLATQSQVPTVIKENELKENLYGKKGCLKVRQRGQKQ